MADMFSDETIVEDNASEEITLDTLVGENQKYKTPDDLAKAYANADAAILRQKAELAELRAADKVKTDLLEAQLKRTNSPEERKPVANEHREQEVPQKAETPNISELVREELLNASEEKRRADNINRATDSMTNHFGSIAKAQDAIKRRAAELNVSFEWLRDVASDSPAAFFASMGITPSARSSSTPGYSNEVVLDRINNAGLKNFKYFDEIRKSNPKSYYSPEMQRQVLSSLNELGEEKFFRT